VLLPVGSGSPEERHHQLKAGENMVVAPDDATAGGLAFRRASHPGKKRNARCQAQLEPLISRPLADWIGRAFIGYSRAKMPICSGEIDTGFFITIHSTPSLQGGVVSEPM
jgi:hypothetical protein